MLLVKSLLISADLEGRTYIVPALQRTSAISRAAPDSVLAWPLRPSQKCKVGGFEIKVVIVVRGGQTDF